MAKRKVEQITAKDYEISQPKRENTPIVEEQSEERLLAKNHSVLKFKEYLEFTNMATPLRIKLTLGFWAVISAVMGLLLLFTNLSSFSTGSFLLGIVLLIFGGVFLIFFFYVLPRKTAMSYVKEDVKHQGMDGGEAYRDFHFYETYFDSSTSDGRSNRVSYDKLHDMYVSKDLFSVALNRQHGYVMRNDGFTHGSMEIVKKHIESYVKENRKKDEKQRRNRKRGEKMDGEA